MVRLAQDIRANLLLEEEHRHFVWTDMAAYGRGGSFDTNLGFRKTLTLSTTSPSIKAIGTTSGIGVYKDLGKFKFYDGIITASTSAIPRDNITTDVEHLYEPTFHTDAYGNDVCILTWMRDLPSQPGN